MSALAVKERGAVEVSLPVTILEVMEAGQAQIEEITRAKDRAMLELVEALQGTVARLTEENSVLKMQLTIGKEGEVVQRAEVAALQELNVTMQARLEAQEKQHLQEVAALKTHVQALEKQIAAKAQALKEIGKVHRTYTGITNLYTMENIHLFQDCKRKLAAFWESI